MLPHSDLHSDICYYFAINIASYVLYFSEFIIYPLLCPSVCKNVNDF